MCVTWKAICQVLFNYNVLVPSAPHLIYKNALVYFRGKGGRKEQRKGTSLESTRHYCAADEAACANAVAAAAARQAAVAALRAHLRSRYRLLQRVKHFSWFTYRKFSDVYFTELSTTGSLPDGCVDTSM